MSQYPPPPQTPGQPYPMQPPPPASGAGNGLAITSLVLGIVGMCVPLLSLGAIICGGIAMGKTRDSRSGGRGMAIAGLVLGCVGLVMTLLIAILLPSLNKARETANRVKCQSNMSQIGKAFLLYANENKGYAPPNLSLLVTTLELDVDTFTCPSSDQTPGKTAADVVDDNHLSYVYLLSEKDQLFMLSSDWAILHEKPGAHDDDGMNILFADGHTEFYRKADADKLLAEQAAKRRQLPGQPR